MTSLKPCYSQWIQQMSNGDTAVCFSGADLERLTIKMVRFDSLVSATYFDKLIIENLEKQVTNCNNIVELERKQTRKYKFYFHSTAGISAIIIILAVFL